MNCLLYWKVIWCKTWQERSGHHVLRMVGADLTISFNLFREDGNITHTMLLGLIKAREKNLAWYVKQIYCKVIAFRQRPNWLQFLNSASYPLSNSTTLPTVTHFLELIPSSLLVELRSRVSNIKGEDVMLQVVEAYLNQINPWKFEPLTQDSRPT